MDRAPAGGDPDIILIGARIVSATLGVFLKELAPPQRSQCSKRSKTAASKTRRPGTTPAPAMPPIAK
jgi:hypothetical protein